MHIGSIWGTPKILLLGHTRQAKSDSFEIRPRHWHFIKSSDRVRNHWMNDFCGSFQLYDSLLRILTDLDSFSYLIFIDSTGRGELAWFAAVVGHFNHTELWKVSAVKSLHPESQDFLKGVNFCFHNIKKCSLYTKC